MNFPFSKNYLSFWFLMMLSVSVSSCSECEEPPSATGFTIPIDYRSLNSDENLLQNDSQIENNLSFYTTSNDTLYYDIRRRENGNTFILLPPFYFGAFHISYNTEQTNDFYVNYYDDIDTLKIVLFFQSEDCGFSVQKFDFYVNEILVEEDERGTYSIYK